MTAELPTHLHYTVEHEWLDDGAPATVGITGIAADALGDIVYLELPAVGEEITAGAVVGEIESTKSVSELYSPVSGTVVEVNQAAVDDPSVVNSDPYGQGWLLKVEVTSTGPLLTSEEYTAQNAG
ncbi:glycine cleavage system protein GcvH [Cellulomonas sp. Root137]|uniref:glycine cleavage system protein GcvH n=1 Tax=Cellulomonas sp. Root137 TaxID=1736459 RepID=UPI0006F78EB0|nr:glycine cleavage system protein GcvH [Cellulomonas sp. Root137]KQY46302.1 glycine cleavage system protein H [Cellulomonas sp. Root137]KRD43451.1 glycine cleavage system protein H [Cellulomonas sp. Root930]